MGDRILSGMDCNDPACKDHGRGSNRCESRIAFAARVHGRSILRAHPKFDGLGNIEALTLELDDGQVLCFDPEVAGDRITVTMVDGR